MDIISSIILGIVQGLTEFIPISSSGHLILARELFGFTVGGDSPMLALAFDAVLQLATILAVLVYFRKDIWNLVLTAGRIIGRREVATHDRVYLSAVIIGTIPAVIVGLFLEKYMETVFRSAFLVACMMLVGALLMYVAEWYGKRHVEKTEVSVLRAFQIGLFQCLALIPGVSRSGATISGGLFMNLSREQAARFSFILSFPIILGSGLKKMVELIHTGAVSVVGFDLVVGSVFAFVVGLSAIHFLIRFLKTHSLNVFIWYRVVVALIVFVLLAL